MLPGAEATRKLWQARGPLEAFGSCWGPQSLAANSPFIISPARGETFQISPPGTSGWTRRRTVPSFSGRRQMQGPWELVQALRRSCRPPLPPASAGTYQPGLWNAPRIAKAGSQRDHIPSHALEVICEHRRERLWGGSKKTSRNHKEEQC